jgi:hypothetical protein
VTVQEGGQLRLTSSNNEEGARDYLFGGDIFLNGQGRGEAVPADSGLGRLGALRYDPGDGNNTARVGNAVEIFSASDLHVDGGSNRLELLGGIRGTGSISKTGGGSLASSGDNSGFGAPIVVLNGTFELRGSLTSSLSADADGSLDLDGTAGELSGEGELILPATRVTTPGVSALQRSFLMTSDGVLDPAATPGENNALVMTGNPGTPLSQDLYLDLPGGIQATTRVQGAYLMPSGTNIANVLSAPTRVLVPDPSGSEEFFGQTWSENSSASITAVPISGTQITLEIRFDGQPLTFADWQAANFSGADLADSAISGPEAAPFGDGVANLLRYALGVAPGENALESLPELSPGEGSLGFAFSYDPGRRGIRWTVESSSVLNDWENAEILFDSASEIFLPTEDQMLNIGVNTEADRQFIRLRIEQTG